MMNALRKLFGCTVEPIVREPVTRDTVKPAPRDPVFEERIRQAKGDLAGDIMKLERKSWQIRQHLANDVIRIVSGEP